MIDDNTTDDQIVHDRTLKTYEHTQNFENTKDKILSYHFLRDAGIYNRLANEVPGICTVSEIGKGYIIMENYAETLATALNPGRKNMNYYAVDDALIPIAKLLITVHMMHERGVVNLDITPESLFYEPMYSDTLDEDGQFITKDNLIIHDFGRAVVYTADELEYISDLRKTATQMLSSGEDIYPLLHKIRPVDSLMYGPYAAPENYVDVPRGSLLLPESDIWSVGAILYEMLTGHKLNSVVHKNRDSRKIYLKRKDFEEISSPLEFLGVVSDDMRQEGFAIYDKRWAKYKNNKNKLPDNSFISRLYILEKAQNKLNGAMDENIKSHLFDLLRGMLDPNPLTRFTAKECLKSPLFNSIYTTNLLPFGNLHIADNLSRIPDFLEISSNKTFGEINQGSVDEIPKALRNMYIFAGVIDKLTIKCNAIEKVYFIYSRLFSSYPRLRHTFINITNKLLDDTSIDDYDNNMSEIIAFSALAVSEIANYGRSTLILGTISLVDFVVSMQRSMVYNITSTQSILDTMGDVMTVDPRKSILPNILPSIFGKDRKGSSDIKATINRLYTVIYFIFVNLCMFDVWD